MSVIKRTYTPISVVYRTKRGAIKIETFTDLRCPDKIVTKLSTKTPRDCEILEIGVGKDFRQKYMKKYKNK